jgi:hypothetical protein
MGWLLDHPWREVDVEMSDFSALRKVRDEKIVIQLLLESDIAG